MKKLISILVLIIATQLETKAQQVKLFIVTARYASLKPLAIPGDNTFSKKMDTSGNNLPVKNYDYYMRKRKSALTTGLVTLGVAVVFSGIGLLVANNKNISENDFETGALLLIAGVASGIASFPFLIMADVYKYKAKLHLSSQKTAFGVPSNVSKSITGITLSIPLGK